MEAPEGLNIWTLPQRLADLADLGAHENAIEIFERRYKTLHDELTFMLWALEELGEHQSRWVQTRQPAAQPKQASVRGKGAEASR